MRKYFVLLGLLLCVLSINAYNDNYLEYIDYYTEQDGTPTVLVSKIIGTPSNGVIRVPEFITDNEGNKIKVVGIDEFAKNSYSKGVKKIVLPSTFREIGCNVEFGNYYGVFDNLICRCGLEEIEVVSSNPHLKSVDGMLLSKDGKVLYFLSLKAIKKSTLSIPEGVEIIYPSLEDAFEEWPLDECKMECLILPESLKAYNCFFYNYKHVIHKSRQAPVLAKDYLYGPGTADIPYWVSYMFDLGFKSSLRPNYFHDNPDKRVIRKVYFPEGCKESYQYSRILENPIASGCYKELQLEGDKKVNINMSFENNVYQWGTINGTPIENNKTYLFHELEPVKVQFQLKGYPDYFFNSADECPLLYRVEEDEEAEGDQRRVTFTYEFFPDDETTIAFGTSAIYSDGNFYFKKIKDYARIAGYKGEIEEITTLDIPECVELNGELLPVYELEESSFGWWNLPNEIDVHFPENLKRIGEFCFFDTNISKLDLPDGLEEIGGFAFKRNSLKNEKEELILPKSLKRIGDLAFEGYNFNKIVIPSDFITYQAMPFSSSGGEDNTIEDVIIEGNGTPFYLANMPVIKNLTSYRNLIRSVNVRDLPSPIENLELNGDYIEVDFEIFKPDGDGALRNLKIKGENVVLKNKWKSGVRRPTYKDKIGNKLEKIDISCVNFDMTNSDFASIESLKDVVVNSSQSELSYGSFLGCTNLTSLKVDNVSALKQGFAEGCSSLREFVIPASAGYIHSTAFAKCESLRKVVFDSSAEPIYIASCAFNDCSIEHLVVGRQYYDNEPSFFRSENLKKLELGSNVTSLSNYAFADCTNLREIYCESSAPPTIGPQTFRNVPTDLCRVYVKGPDGEYREAGGWKEFFPVSEITNVVESRVKAYSDSSNIVVENNEGSAIYIYNLSGVKVASVAKAMPVERFLLPRGIYIVIAGDSATKIIN